LPRDRRHFRSRLLRRGRAGRTRQHDGRRARRLHRGTHRGVEWLPALDGAEAGVRLPDLRPRPAPAASGTLRSARRRDAGLRAHRMTSARPLTIALTVLVLSALPFSTANAYYLDIVVQIYMWAAASVAWNLLGGYAGQFSLGHAAFFGIGAYTSSLLLLQAGLTPWLGMLAGALLSTLFALVIGGLPIPLPGP